MVKVITDETFKAEVLEAGTPILVDFFATWCGPCKMMAPVLDKLSAKYAAAEISTKKKAGVEII